MIGQAERREPPLSASVVTLLAIAAGGAIANNYAIQPSLAAVAHDLGITYGTVSLTASGVMLGYLLGLALLVPLVDHASPRRLIPSQLTALAVALCLTSAAPSAVTLLVCLVLVGATTTVAAQASSIVGKLADPAHRGRQMGTISAGISAGILLSRFIGGSLTEWLGWRSMLLCFAAACFVAAVLTALWTPHRQPRPSGGYFSTLRSVTKLLVEFSELRYAVVAGMLWFFAFNAVWVGLSLRLAQPPYSLSANEIGLYSLAGILGLFVTPIAGRLADRYGSQRVKIVGLIAAAVAALLLLVTLGHPFWTAMALAIFDAGCFAAQVANQAGIVRLNPARSGALNSVYLLLYYSAGAVGTAIAGFLIVTGGWTILAGTVVVVLVGAVAVSMVDRRAHAERSESRS